MTKSSRILYMGTPEFAVYPLQKLVEEGYNVVGVVTSPDKASGRGLKLNSSDVKKYTETLNIPIYQPISLKDEQFITTLQSLDLDIIIVVAFRMLPKIVWEMPKLGTFNLHASLLPNYRGAAPINWALIKGEELTGVTTFLLDENIDTGSIIFQEECEININDSFETLHDKLKLIGGDLVLKTVNYLEQGNSKFILQSSIEAQLGDISRAPKLTKDNTRIDWQDTVENIYNFVRGLCPYPASHSIIKGNKGEFPVKIFETSYEILEHSFEAGHIFTDNKSFIKVACQNGFLFIKDIQLAGKKRLKVKEFLAGFRDPENYIFY